MQIVNEWWREPVDYAGYVRYFADRGLARALQLTISGIVGCVSIFAMILLLPVAAASPASMTIVFLFAGGGLFWSVMWWARPWPTHWQSRAFIASADLGIAAVALMSSNWILGLFAYHCFALVSVYLMFLDGPKALAAHNAVVLTALLIFIVLNIGEGRIADRTSAGIIFAAAIPIAAVTVVLMVGIQLLRNDANKSTTDPMTGLLNRRGLYLHFRGLLTRNETPGHLVTVIVADLDQFKSINDKFGHAEGDNVLVRTAQRIRTAVSSDALVARAGGEEFVVVDLTAANQDNHIAEAIRRALSDAGDVPAVTASLGVHTREWAHLTSSGTDMSRLLDEAIRNADQAMFRAKRAGGNTIRTA
ncbi:GGDEF domain-containing protein [Mycobacterium sp. 141]|uniref:GGDEF domain-containing protein n=1 Tax=Mycobacterium sp. 141 TaxID=1120797 RepID=UPI0003657A79|nr:GGDEF domain-containing protein [Mycobacterium sp. 141]